jgi:hypothetical protein
VLLGRTYGIQRSTFGISAWEMRRLTDLRRNLRIVYIFIFIPRVEVRELSLQVEGPQREEGLEDRAFVETDGRPKARREFHVSDHTR